MRKLYIMLLLAFAFCFTISCGRKTEEVKTNLDNAGKMQQAVNNMQQSMNTAETKRQERIKKGDTLAMNYTKLRTYLPDNIPGYKAEDVDGQTTNTAGFSISTVSRKYVKEGDPDDYIEIQLVDYNQAGQMFQGLTAAWASGISVESDSKMEKTFNPGYNNAAAYEALDKKGHSAEATYALDWRFIVHVKASKQNNTDFVKKVATSMKLNELANM